MPHTRCVSFIPVHITSIAGNSFEPMVTRYSELETSGTALLAQYSEIKVNTHLHAIHVEPIRDAEII